MFHSKKNVLILFGGRSEEHEVSIVSAKGVVSNLDSAIYSPVLVGIHKTGTFHPYSLLEFQALGSQVTNAIVERKDQYCVFAHAQEGTDMIVFDQDHAVLSKIRIDVVFPVLHGPFGEDGAIQGWCETLSLPYVGSHVLSSALCMDKIYAKYVLAHKGFSVAPFRVLNTSQSFEQDKYEDLKEELGSPFFLKAPTQGSSRGVHKVYNKDQFKYAVADVLSFGSKILAEKHVKNAQELECAVLKKNGALIASVVGEIKSNYDFYSYEAKYIDPNGAELLYSAKISDSLMSEIQETSKEVFKLLQCQGMARVDFLFGDTPSKLFVSEVNTIPGFTPISMYPALLMHSGIEYKDALHVLISEALSEKEPLSKARKEPLDSFPQRKAAMA